MTVNINMKIKEAIGKKFNKMTVLNNIGNKRVNCKCECGTIKECSWYDLKRERIKGCGCQRNTPEIRKNLKLNAYCLIKKGILNKGGDYHQKENREFKYCLKTIKGKGRKNCFIDLKDLKEIWEKQKGICVYSKIKLKLPTHQNYKPDVNYKIASVDRIDSSQPYTKNNIQFVSRTINYAKNTLSHKEMCEFIDAVVILRSGGGVGVLPSESL